MKRGRSRKGPVPDFLSLGAVLIFGADGGRLEAWGEGVFDETGPDFFHGDPFELVRSGRADGRRLETRQRPTPELLGPLSGDVHEQKTAGDRSGPPAQSAVVYLIT